MNQRWHFYVSKRYFTSHQENGQYISNSYIVWWYWENICISSETGFGVIISKFLSFKCLFSQNSFGVFRDQQFEENGETQKGQRYKAFLNSRDHFCKRGGQQRRGKPRLKMNLYFWQEFRQWLDLFTVSYSDTRQLQHWTYVKKRWVPTGNLNNLPSRFLSLDLRRIFWWFHVAVFQRNARKCTKF